MNSIAAMEAYLKEHPGAIKDLSAGIATASEAVFFLSRYMTEDEFGPIRNEAVESLKFLGRILDLMNGVGVVAQVQAQSAQAQLSTPADNGGGGTQAVAEVPTSSQPELHNPDVLSIPRQYMMMNVTPNPAFIMTDRVRALAEGGAPLKELLSDALNAGVSISQVIELWDKHRPK